MLGFLDLTAPARRRQREPCSGSVQVDSGEVLWCGQPVRLEERLRSDTCRRSAGCTRERMSASSLNTSAACTGWTPPRLRSFSVGGEMMLQAAATNTGLRAVVSEGAGVRSVREHLLRGPRGWFSFPEAAVQTAAVAVLSQTAPPASLADLVPRIAPRPLFLIYAGQGGGGELNPDYYDAAYAEDALEDPGSGTRRRLPSASTRVRTARDELPRPSASRGEVTRHATAIGCRHRPLLAAARGRGTLRTAEREGLRGGRSVARPSRSLRPLPLGVAGVRARGRVRNRAGAGMERGRGARRRR